MINMSASIAQVLGSILAQRTNSDFEFVVEEDLQGSNP